MSCSLELSQGFSCARNHLITMKATICSLALEIQRGPNIWRIRPLLSYRDLIRINALHSFIRGSAFSTIWEAFVLISKVLDGPLNVMSASTEDVLVEYEDRFSRFARGQGGTVAVMREARWKRFRSHLLGA